MIGITRYMSFIPIGLRTFILRKFFVITQTGFDTSFDMTHIIIWSTDPYY